jgi:aminoglycoside phosphotransferase (APT) family kinase protein
MMEAVARHDAVPVPKLWFAEANHDVLGVPFYVMARVPGRPAPDHPPYNADGWIKDLDPPRRRLVWDNGLECMAALHRIDWHEGFEFLDDPAKGTTGLDQLLTHLEASLEWAAAGRPQPTADAGMAWIRDHQPTDPPVAVLWGDARPGNILYADDQSVAAVLDWEMASLGPPEADLGWWLFMDRFWAEGFGLVPLDGLPTRDETVEFFASALGRPLGDVHYYEALGALRMSIILVRAFDLMIEEGGVPPDTDLVTNNPATHILADLLGLASPGISSDLDSALETSATVDRGRS